MGCFGWLEGAGLKMRSQTPPPPPPPPPKNRIEIDALHGGRGFGVEGSGFRVRALSNSGYKCLNWRVSSNLSNLSIVPFLVTPLTTSPDPLTLGHTLERNQGVW